MDNVEIRVLTQDELDSIKPHFESVGAVMPNPQTSFAVGGVNGAGEVVAFLFFQLQVHSEPIKIEPGYENLYMRLVETGEQELVKRCGPTLVYAFTPPGKVTRLAQMAGMQLEPWVVLSKVCGAN